MRSVLIVCGTEKGKQLLASILQNTHSVSSATSGAQARRMLDTQDPDLILINTPLPDEFGDSLALFATEVSAAGVVMVVRAEMAGEWTDRMASDGVIVLEKPLHSAWLQQALAVASATRSRLSALQKQNLRLRQQMDDIRLVARAKILLVQHLNMTEPQAHHFIEKQAMDRRVPKRQVAEGILRSYEP